MSDTKSNPKAMSVADLRARARYFGITPGTMRKDDLVAAIAEAEERVAAVETAPEDFGTLPPLEAAPDDEPSAEEEAAAVEAAVAPSPTDPIAGDVDAPPIVHPRFRLMSDIKIATPRGAVRLLAGRIVDAGQYDLDAIRSAGGVLAPMIER